MTAAAPREVWFIRHAESIANAGGVTTEAATYSLSELGFRQAAQLAAALPCAPELIVHSTYVRARVSAEPAMRRFAAVPVEEWPVQEVQYLAPALCVGTTQDQRRELSLAYWEKCDPDFAAEGAESFGGFIARARAALTALATRRERRIFVFTHGQFMSALAWLILTRPAVIHSAAMSRFYDFIHGYAVPNCSILPAYFHPDGACSLGGLRVLEGVEGDSMDLGEGGLAGV